MSPFALVDRCWETTTQTGAGTGTVTLGGAASFGLPLGTMQSFAAGAGNGALVDYCIVTAGAWIVRRGVVTSGTLVSTQILSSSAGAGVDITLSGTSHIIGVSSAAFQIQNVVASLTANHQILAGESSTHYNNAGATGAVVATLPPAAPGLRFVFAVLTAQTFTPNTHGTDAIQFGPTASIAGGNLSSNQIGSVVALECHVAGQWVVSSFIGNWTVT